ncbi:hypothetical protein ONS95_011046 [Cadophora gregata]|uniref:uncharacterized protein n=1 Tax=Cadophora gregata TaxID=51156 RepID=UPI0026DC281E|nr:uncharacterized protein ONS95_011046 [Cadophora gregata]KAK0119606.1 hypothetical protein ONS95_011046 [Cadophora gregata]
MGYVRGGRETLQFNRRTGSDLWNHGGDDNGKDDDDKYGAHKSKICWTVPHAPKSYQTYHAPKTWTKPVKDHKTITYSDTPMNPLPTTLGPPQSYTVLPPQPTTETVGSSTVPVLVIPTPQPVTSLIPTTPSTIVTPAPTLKPSTTAPPQQGNSTVPSPPIFTGDATAHHIRRASLLVAAGSVWLAMLLI